MNLNRTSPLTLLLGLLLLVVGFFSATLDLQANVYATKVRVNGGTTNLVANAGDVLTISYILNEPASLGVTIQILSGSTIVRSLDFTGGAPGAVRGLNEVAWDTSLAPVPSGTYSLALIARSAGYTNWTQITSDTADANTYVSDGHGIAVNRNSSSPFYGRIFVSNSSSGPNPNNPGDVAGILKFNADTSDADEGISTAGSDGVTWLGGGVSPWKVEVSADDSVYVSDLGRGSQVYGWDQTVSSNSMRAVLRQDNLVAGEALSGPAIVGSGTNTQVWMSDTNQAHAIQWQLNSSLVCSSNDPGVAVITNTIVTNFVDVALDPSGNIYTCANIQKAGDPSPRVFRYHAYIPSSNGSPETNVDWAVGARDDSYSGASGIAVDPTGTYLAVSFQGPIDLGFNTNGNTKILLATNGALVANLDLGLVTQNDANHDDTDCAWDAVGNVYYIDNYFSRWRTVSPPGTNQATTLALGSVQIVGDQTLTSIQITRRSVSGPTVTIEFSAGANESASTFSILSAPTVNGAYAPSTVATVTQLSAGLFRATLPKSGVVQFYRVRR